MEFYFFQSKCVVIVSAALGVCSGTIVLGVRPIVLLARWLVLSAIVFFGRLRKPGFVGSRLSGRRKPSEVMMSWSKKEGHLWSYMRNQFGQRIHVGQKVSPCAVRQNACAVVNWRKKRPKKGKGDSNLGMLGKRGASTNDNTMYHRVPSERKKRKLKKSFRHWWMINAEEKVPIGSRTRASCATNRRPNHYTIETSTINGIKILIGKTVV